MGIRLYIWPAYMAICPVCRFVTFTYASFQPLVKIIIRIIIWRSCCYTNAMHYGSVENKCSYFWKEEQIWSPRMKMVQFLYMMLVQEVVTYRYIYFLKLIWLILLGCCFMTLFLLLTTISGFAEIVQLLFNRASDAEHIRRMLESVDSEGDTVSTLPSLFFSYQEHNKKSWNNVEWSMMCPSQTPCEILSVNIILFPTNSVEMKFLTFRFVF